MTRALYIPLWCLWLLGNPLSGASLERQIVSASSTGDAQRVAQLLEQGADADSGIKNNTRRPLTEAIQNGHVEIVDLLLEHGADPKKAIWDQKGDHRGFGTTPLHMAVEHQDHRAMSLLIDHGADVDSGTLAGRTPLFVAVLMDDLNGVNILLKANADIYLEGFYRVGKKSPLMPWGPLPLASKLDRDLIVKALKNTEQAHLGEALIRASARGARSEVLELLEKGADPNAQDEKAMNPVLAALFAGQRELARELFERGSGVNRMYEGGEAPMKLLTAFFGLVAGESGTPQVFADLESMWEVQKNVCTDGAAHRGVRVGGARRHRDCVLPRPPGEVSKAAIQAMHLNAQKVIRVEDNEIVFKHYPNNMTVTFDPVEGGTRFVMKASMAPAARSTREAYVREVFRILDLQ